MILDGLTQAIGNTPLIKIESLSELTGCNILGKAEFMNPGGSVKDRAALWMIKEAESNLANWDKSHPSSKAIGARELIAFLNNNISKDQLREKIIIATRQYAKRQRTWFRSKMKNWEKYIIE